MPDSRGEGSVSAAQSVLQLRAHISAEDAARVFRRKLPRAQTSVVEAVHPFWWSEHEVSTGSAAVSRRVHVLVNAVTGRGFIADFEPRPAAAPASSVPEIAVGAEEAGRTARSIVRTKVVKTVKLGMRIELQECAEPRLLLKPNWLVSGANRDYGATMLVDGLDATHYVVRAQKRRQGPA